MVKGDRLQAFRLLANDQMAFVFFLNINLKK